MIARICVILIAVLVAGNAAADISIQVPSECAALAARHGIPSTLAGRVAVAKAIGRLNRLDRSDSQVRVCRAAVRRLLGP